MAVIKVPLNQAKLYRDAAIRSGKLSADVSPEEQAQALSQLTSDDNNVYDFSQLHDANPLVKARSWLHENTTGAYDKYVDPLIKQALGDNSVTRVGSNILRGVIDSAPELAMIALTRRKNSASLMPYFGNTAAAVSAGTNAYGETGDPTTAATNAIVTGLTPALVTGAGKVASRVSPSLTSTPLRESLVSGAATNVATSIPSVALTPEMSKLSESGPIVATERVNPLDLGRAGERLWNTATNPEALAEIAVGGTLMDAAVGYAANRQMKALRENEVARAKLKGISEVQKPVRAILEENGIRVPEAATESDLDVALNRLTISMGADSRQIAKNLWNSTDVSKMSADELAYKQRLDNNELTVDESIKLDEGVYHAGNDLAAKAVYDMENVYNDIDTSTYDPNKANAVSKFVDWVSRGFFNADENTAHNPVAHGAISILKGLESGASRLQNEQLVRIGQNRDGSLTGAEALSNIDNILNSIRGNKDFEQGFQKFLDDGNKSLYEPMKDDLGNIIYEGDKPKMRRKNMFELDPPKSIEQIMKEYNMTEEQAMFAKNIQNQAIHDAKLRFEANEYSLATKLAEAVASKFNVNRQKALSATVSFIEAYRPIISRQLRTISGDGITKPTPEFIDFMSKKMLEHFDVKNIDDDTTSFYTVLSKALLNGESALYSDYAFNGSLGYTSRVRRGDYSIYYKDADGIPTFKSFGTKKELDAVTAQLDKAGIKYDTYDAKRTDLPSYDALRIAELANLQREMSRAKHDFQRALTPEELNKLSPETREIIFDTFDSIERNFTAANNAVAKASLHEKGTLFQRKHVEGATALEMILNTIEKSKQIARSVSYSRDYATLNFLTKDPVLLGDQPLHKYVQEKIDYMNNQDTSEFRPLRSAAVLFYLTGSTSFLFQNLFQVPTLGLARWRNFTGRSSADFVKSMTKASQLIHDYDHLATKLNKQDPMLLQCMKELEKRGVFSQAYSEEIIGRKQIQRTIGDIDSGNSLAEKVKNKYDDLIDWSTQLITSSEAVNRKWITAAYLISENNYKPLNKRSKSDVEAVLRRASELSDAVNFTGGKATRPYFIQMFGNTKLHGASLAIMALQNYGLNLTAMLTRQLRQAIPGLDSSKRISSKSYKELKDRTGLLKTMLIMQGITGLYGLPGREQFDEIITKMFGEKYRPSRNAVNTMNSLLEQIGLDEEGEYGSNKVYVRNKIVDALQYGLPALGDVHLSNLVSNPMSPTALLSDPNASSFLRATGQMFSKVYNFGKAVKDGNVRVASRNLPSALNNVRKMVELADTNTLTGSRGDMYAAPKQRGLMETVGTLFGGMPLDVAKGLDQNRQEANVTRELNDAKVRLHDLAADLADRPQAVRALYEKAVADGVILPDETKFVELVADRLARRDKRYVKEAPLEVRKVIDEIRETFGNNPIYLSRLHELKTALELAIGMGSPRAAAELVEKLFNVDLGKSVLQENGVDGKTYNAMMGRLNPVELEALFSDE